MNFISNLLRTVSKGGRNDAIHDKKVRFFTPEKQVGRTRSESYGEDKNWAQISLNTSFYIQKLIEVKLGKTDIIPKSKHQNSHMVYQICVLTSDFQYSIKKRFSLFNQFYMEIKKQINHLGLVFPKKTILVSGTNIEVVTERYEILNTFIKRVFKEVKEQKDQSLGLKFINFIQIQEEFQKRKIKTYSELPKLTHEMNESFSIEETSIVFELKKLNDYNNHQKDIIIRLENYIAFKNHKLTNDQIKTLLVGNNAINIKGILNLSLSINNEIKALQLLKFLIDYLSPEKKSYHDKIFKQFEKLPLEVFHFDFDQIKNNFNIIEFKKTFFILLELYCHNKFFDQTKILQRYPQLLSQFSLWKNLSDINHGNVCKKTASASNQQLQKLLKMSLSHPEKAKSFEINPKISSTKPGTISPFTTADNLQNLVYDLTNSDDKYKKFSFRSNDSTSQLTVEEDWENSKMKLQLTDTFQYLINDKINSNNQILKNSDLFSLKTNKFNKIIIEILKTQKTLSQCQKLLNSWNKLIYDQRHDSITRISRIYMKLNGKCKIFKYKQQDEKLEKKEENYICITKKRLESNNSITKSAKQNIDQNLKAKLSNFCNGFEEMITIERIEESCESSEEEKQAYCKVKIEFNFEGEEDYFRTEIMGETTYLLECALEAFSK